LISHLDFFFVDFRTRRRLLNTIHQGRVCRKSTGSRRVSGLLVFFLVAVTNVVPLSRPFVFLLLFSSSSFLSASSPRGWTQWGTIE
jgi:hypothetical protein